MRFIMKILSLLPIAFTVHAADTNLEYISRWYQTSGYSEVAAALEEQAPYAGRIISISSLDGKNFKIILWINGSADGTQCFSITAIVGITADSNGELTRQGQAKFSQEITRLKPADCGM